MGAVMKKARVSMYLKSQRLATHSRAYEIVRVPGVHELDSWPVNRHVHSAREVLHFAMRILM